MAATTKIRLACAAPRLRPPSAGIALAILLLWGGNATSAAEDAPVALPPFLVEETAKGPPWRFAETMGYEILSRCDDATTRRVVEAHYQLHVLLGEILPPELRFTVSVPRTLILYDEELQPAASREVIARLLRTPGAPEPVDSSAGAGFRGLRVPVATPRFSFLPNLRLWDRDSMAVFMIVRRDDFNPEQLALTHDYIAFLVKNRLPTLPPWFMSGMLGLYAHITYTGKQLTLAPLEWISSAQTNGLKRDSKTAPPLQPLAEFLRGELPPRLEGQAHEPYAAWRAQAMWFARWGLDANDGAHRRAYWKFAERVAVSGPSEKLFAECFGFDYAAAQVQLAEYFPKAVRREAIFKTGRPGKQAPLALRNATDGEIARIKGDWERLEVPYVRGISAELAPKYLEQARRTLRRAYDRDDRDPRLLAVMGLCETDAGNDAGARAYLEAAAAAGTIRPRANYELARLRFGEFRANPVGPEGQLTVGQAVDVLKPLFAARAQKPPLPEVYELIGQVWEQGSAKPTRAHLAVLDEGIQLFPRRPALALRAAELNLKHGYREEAAALAEIAMRSATDEPALQQAAQLLHRLGPK